MAKAYISYPKINIFFKVIGFLNTGYCDILSRYIKVENTFFDVLEIKDSPCFKLNGNFNCPLETNTIFRAKLALQEYLGDIQKSRYLESFSIDVDKQIPIFAGLGGGSSNAGIYLLAMNEMLDLGLDKKTLGLIASKVGADVSFFVYDYKSSNVSGIGDIVEEYIEDTLEFEILTPNINAHTNAVFAEFKKEYALNIDLARQMFVLDSINLLKSFSIDVLNDLYAPALRLYPELLEYSKDGYFFSGSGSSFFRLK